MLFKMPRLSKRKRHLRRICHSSSRGRPSKLPKIQVEDPESIDTHIELEVKQLTAIDETDENDASSNSDDDEFAYGSEKEEVF